MDKEAVRQFMIQIPEVSAAACGKEVGWINPQLKEFSDFRTLQTLSMDDVEEAERRLQRFAPYIEMVFPETKETHGIIESPLQKISDMQTVLEENHGCRLDGKLYLKMDSHLAIAGSVKARGGIYEILKYAESLAIQNGMLQLNDNYSILAEPRFKEFFSQYTIQVGSTGNLGMSIGIISAKLGFNVIVHMSSDAKQWKKDLLRSRGVVVKEYKTDYGEAVEQGRRNSLKNPMSYFVDDENSKDLFLGYSVAAKRLKKQLEEQKVKVDAEHPLFLYIPCGIGGAPGGITFGIKQIFGDAAHCFFTEPTNACCMLLGMATGLHNKICVQDFGISGKTQADGLAVGRPSAFVGKIMEPMLSGIFTIQDSKLFVYMNELVSSENIFIEPSSCAGFAFVENYEVLERYIKMHQLEPVIKNAVHIVWATGGSMVPEETVEQYKKMYIGE